MTGLLEIDTTVFHWINSGFSNPVCDLILPIMRNKLTWIPVYLIIIYYIVSRFKSRWWMLLFLFIGVGLSDYSSSSIIKKSVERVRPCNNDGMEVIERVHCGGGYSFTSSHATNHFFISLYLCLVVFKSRRSRWILMLWASIVSVSQVYVGVHYPLDILGGASLGMIIAWLMYTAYANVPKPQVA